MTFNAADAEDNQLTTIEITYLARISRYGHAQVLRLKRNTGQDLTALDLLKAIDIHIAQRRNLIVKGEADDSDKQAEERGQPPKQAV